MIVTFKYNNKIYTTDNLDNKLQKLGITLSDIDIQKKQDMAIGEIDTSIIKHHFKNNKTGFVITSIYKDLQNLKNDININEWIKID